MAKKDFTQVNTSAVYNTIAQATAEEQETQETQEIVKTRKPRKTYNAQEKAKYMQTLNTAGRKGVSLPRINLAFTQPNYDYICTMSRVTGLNLTEFVNEIIDRHRENHSDLYNKAVEFRNSL